MRHATRLLLAPLLLSGLLFLPGCGKGTHGDEVTVSVIGGPARLRPPAGKQPMGAEAALLGAVAQGLVRFDEAGQVEPGVAIRWAVSDDGLYYTFRLDSRLADADLVARQLRRLVRAYRDQSLDGELDAVNEIVAVTPEVIEIRLSEPRPDLMPILAGPGFALLRSGRGSGPLTIDGEPGPLTTLRAIPPETADEEEQASAARRRVFLRGERVGRAVARFANGQANLVLGGGFDDFIHVRVAKLPPASIQIDPATGLFGFRIDQTSPALMRIEIRQALSMALDRDALGQMLGVPGWRSTQGILPPGLTDIVQPARPFWAQAIANVGGADRRASAARVAEARRIVASWCAQRGCDGPIRIRLAMPRGPGATILFAGMSRQWRAIGVDAERVGPNARAELRLIDEVAPADQADWFLSHFLCAQGRPCSDEADQAYRAAQTARTPAERARAIADAEQKLVAISSFLPIAQPVRWSLATPDLAGFRTNVRAVHPLHPLIGNQKGR